MSFYIKIDEDLNKNDLLKINIDKIDIEKNMIFKKFYKYVKGEKEKIDELEETEIWDKMKKIGNPFELIYTTYSKKKKNDSLSSYIPISRSYFKMWEIFHNFDLFKKFNKYEKFIFSHLAEGPGGFMEATYNYRKKITSTTYLQQDQYYSITLQPDNEHIPDFNKLKKLFSDNQNIHINYGNLYYINDVKNYINNFKNKKAHFVTSDGGFDYSSDFNGQEINSCEIIYSECVIALNILRKNGSFVCKVFDLFSITMIQILFIVFYCFEEVYLYKPETSRPANSEKYLVCLYYKDNLTEQEKINLLNIINIWYEMSLNLDKKDSIILKNIKINNSFIHKLEEYNKSYIESQMYFLNNTLELAKNKIDKNKYNDIIQEQVKNAIQWCKNYNIEINKNSIYYKN